MKTGASAVTSLEIRANAFDLLSRLADDLAHEIKNPIHAAVINLELIRRRIAAGQGDAALDRLHVLETEVGRAHDLTDWLLRLLRPGKDAARLMALDQVVVELLPLIELICRLARVELRFVPVGNGSMACISPAHARHALLNLVVNALEAMRPEGGRLEIAGACSADAVMLRLTDTGHGVPPEARCRIGTPGFTTRPGHGGLGLAVAHALMDEAGGRVELLSAGGDGEGASFLLTVPRATGA